MSVISIKNINKLNWYKYHLAIHKCLWLEVYNEMPTFMAYLDGHQSLMQYHLCHK